MKTVVSASRRTDIPAFYMTWLEERIQQGFVDVPNPVRKDQSSHVCLRPESVHTLVLWSKNFHPFLQSSLARNNQYRFYFQFSLAHCPEWEPLVIPWQARIRQMQELSRRWSPLQINWRFDPIVFWDRGKQSNMDSFLPIADTCAAMGISHCTVSFVQWYAKVKKRIQPLALQGYDPTLEEMQEHLARLAQEAHDRGIQLCICCQPELESVPHVHKARCIDGPLLGHLAGERCSHAQDSSQRPGCGCTKSSDIGRYTMPCPHGCFYCYAQPGPTHTEQTPPIPILLMDETTQTGRKKEKL